MDPKERDQTSHKPLDEGNALRPVQPARDSITPHPQRAVLPVPPRRFTGSPPGQPAEMSELEKETTLPSSSPSAPQAPANSIEAVPASPPPITDNQQPPSPALSQSSQPHSEPAPPLPAQPEPVVDSIIRKLRGFLSFALFIGSIVVAAVLINQFIFQSYYVDGTSMTPTLQNNDRLIIDKVSRTIATIQGRPYIPERGQIVVLDSSILDQNGNNEQLIKRVIGIPGDTITIKNGVVTIKNSEHPDGFNVDETLGLHLAPTYSSTPITLTVPQNKVFVMGDNRGMNGSFDSRAFGPIDGNQLQGRLLLRIFPLNRSGMFK